MAGLAQVEGADGALAETGAARGSSSNPAVPPQPGGAGPGQAERANQEGADGRPRARPPAAPAAQGGAGRRHWRRARRNDRPGAGRAGRARAGRAAGLLPRAMVDPLRWVERRPPQHEGAQPRAHESAQRGGNRGDGAGAKHSPWLGSPSPNGLSQNDVGGGYDDGAML